MKSYRLRSILLLSFSIIVCSFCKAQELVQCVKESEKYHFDTKTDIAYGAEGKFVYKYGVTGWITFDNATFGDPAPGIIKNGYFIRTEDNSIRIYENANYEPPYIDRPLRGVAWLGEAWNDKVSSIKIPNGYKMIAYEHMDFGGASIVITGSWTLTPENMAWNDRISSFEIVKIAAATTVVNNTPVSDNVNNTTNNTVNIPVEISFNTQYVRMSTKEHGDSVRLDYSPVDKKFNLQSTSRNWKIVPVESNKYKILLQVNGKYWALGSTPDAFPRIGEDTAGIYQLWQIERLWDGYYKISNWGLVQNRSPYPSLFLGSTTKTLFLEKWEEAKSLNGRWSLLSAGKIPPTDQPDRLDGRYFSLISVRDNRAFCLQSYLMGGDVMMEGILDCKGKDGKLYLIKTFNGDYFIKITRMGNRNRQYYLDDNLRRVENLPKDFTNPDPRFTWKVNDIGYGVYIITNTSTGKVLAHTGSYNPSVTIVKPNNTDHERWYLR